MSNFGSTRWLIGIDEAGRGPLAGPVAVGVVAVPEEFDFARWGQIRDSKQLTPEARETWYTLLRATPEVRFAYASAPAVHIDRDGIVPCIRASMVRALRSLALPPGYCRVLLDGGLRAPGEYRMQETIIRGDESVPVIGLASIVAKVRRDRYMTRIAPLYPQYEFGKHKGYGTLLHRERIEEHGLSPLHRRSFCRNLNLRFT